MNAIILAAGLGKRMGINQPKQFLKINGKPILVYSLEVLSKVPTINKIILVHQGGYLEECQNIINDYDIKNVVFVEGGKTRQESVFLGLQLTDSKEVLIHEAARPLVSIEFVDEIIAAFTEDVDAVVPVLPVNFTVAKGDKYMEGILDRSTLRNVQLPQVFGTDTIIKAHQEAIKEDFDATEDSMLVFKYGGKVKFIHGRESNIKITTMMDVKMIDGLLNLNYE